MAALPSAAEPLPSAVVTCPTGNPVLQLANPGPGDVLSQGDYIVSGVAFDASANDGNGISRVDLFLGQRDSGGLFLGAATPGQDTANPRAFQTKVTFPSTVNGGRDFVAYAYSVSGGQITESVPVFVGAAPTPTPTTSSAPTPVPLTSTTTSTCSGSVLSGSVAAQPQALLLPAPVSAAAQPQAPLLSASVAAPMLQLANPSAGDVVSNGDVVVEGTAFDPAATSGAGVDRVDLFLDSRDQGGQPLGSGVPGPGNTFRITARVPANANGGHNFVAYAHSSVTGQESVESVPVFIGAAPTPTPRPTK